MLTSILLIHLRTMPPSYKITGNCIFFSKIKGDNYKEECHVYSIRTDNMTTVRFAGWKHTSVQLIFLFYLIRNAHTFEHYIIQYNIHNLFTIMKIKRIIKSKVLGDISRLLIPCLGFHAPKFFEIIWLSNLSAISVKPD
jgi:hypothetical protein